MTDENGVIQVKYSYDPWGNVKTTGDLVQPFRYAGYYSDDETGLNYLKSRYYSPTLGRFLTRDDYGFIDYSDPQTMNLYAYAGNNPVKNVDPTGKWVETALDAGFMAADVLEIVADPNDPWAWASLAADALCALLPGLTGGRLAVKELEHLLEGICFAEDTKVQTKDGHKLIKDIKVGDEVYSENPETGEKGLKKVKNIYIHETDNLIHVMIGNTKIKTTSTHPFWIDGKGWVAA